MAIDERGLGTVQFKHCQYMRTQVDQKQTVRSLSFGTRSIIGDRAGKLVPEYCDKTMHQRNIASKKHIKPCLVRKVVNNK
jgi:hypothetical protein